VARAVVFGAAQTSWESACAVLGHTWQPVRATYAWSTGQKRRVVVIAAHPDDETIGAGGVTALHALGGDLVTTIVVTDGGASRAGGIDQAEMVRLRARELRDAAALLGAGEPVSLQLPEGAWRPEQARDLLYPLLAEADVVYSPSCVDFHPEHVGVAQVVAGLVQHGQTVRVYEVGVPLTPVLANLTADISAVAAVKYRSLTAFATQSATVDQLCRLARYEARLYGLPAVELFWELSAETFARVMDFGDWRGHPCPFRGIGPRPVSDPLSALVGLRARMRLRALCLEKGGRLDQARP
jgi:LmbE family N-acetylglucosaminyl deacetylase